MSGMAVVWSWKLGTLCLGRTATDKLWNKKAIYLFIYCLWL